MSRRIFGIALLCGSVIGTQSFAAGSCTRESLQSAADSYVEAQTKGDPSMIKLASPVKYIENLKDADIKTGILSSAQKIDFSRSFLDTDQCETFTEVIITDPKHPYVLGTRLRLDGGKVSEINSLVTDEGDWLFNAANDLKWSPQEDWGVIPKDKQGTRESLMAAANAYFDFFSDKNVKVPWGTPCNRLEGGLRTGKGTPDDTCNVGVPNGIKFPGRRYVVDADHGVVDILVRFGGSAVGLPDSHLFRIENGKIRFVHTITVCDQPNCGFPPPNGQFPSQSGAKPGGGAAQSADKPKQP